MNTTPYESARLASIAVLANHYSRLFGLPKNTNARPVIINGVRYKSVMEAGAALGCTGQAIREAIRRVHGRVRLHGVMVEVAGYWLE